MYPHHHQHRGTCRGAGHDWCRFLRVDRGRRIHSRRGVSCATCLRDLLSNLRDLLSNLRDLLGNLRDLLDNHSFNLMIYKIY